MVVLDIGRWLGKSESEVLALSVDEIRRWAIHMRKSNG